MISENIDNPEGQGTQPEIPKSDTGMGGTLAHQGLKTLRTGSH